MENQPKTQKGVEVKNTEPMEQINPILKPTKSSNLSSLGLVVVVAVVVLLGVATGYKLATGKVLSDSKTAPGQTTSVSNDGKKAGSLEKNVKYDEAEGKLVEGGVGSEGTHHLERPGGVSQNVYLTSSTIDLGSFVGKDVKVWGITFAAQKAGWLMDVAQLEVK